MTITPRAAARLPMALTAALFALLLAGCSSMPISVPNPFDRGSDEGSAGTGEEGGEEEGDGRIAVLEVDKALEPDLRFIGVPISIPPAFGNDEWSQPGGEADHTMHHLSGPSQPALVWQAQIGKGGTKRSPLTAPPVVADGRVYVLDNEAQVTAFSEEDGKMVWRTALTPEMKSGDKPFWKFYEFGGADPAEFGFGGGVAVEGGRVFMVTGFATAAALDARTGEVLWEADLPGPVRNPPTAADGLLFAVTTGNQAIALDQATGEEAWTYVSFEEAARFLSSASPAVQSGTVVMPFSSGEVVALEAENGKLLWSAVVSRASRMNALADLNDIAGSPVLDRGAVYAVSHSGQLSAIDLRTGQEVWEIPVGGLNTPWIAGDTLFLVSVDGQLAALSREDGSVKWVRRLQRYENEKKRKNPITWAGPILAGGNLVLTSSNGGLLFLSPQDGSTMAEVSGKRGSTLPPVVANSTIYVVSTDGRLMAYRDRINAEG